MEQLRNLYFNSKPIFDIYLFEIKLHVKKFIIFSIVTILLLIINSFLPYILFPTYQVLSTQADFYQGVLSNYLLIIIAVCLFFSGIICSEFKDKTGIIVFPKINKYKLITGKYLGNLTLVIGIASINYFISALFAYYIYGDPLLDKLLLSFGFTVFYILALSSVVSFFSSFMKSATLTTTITLILFLFAIGIIDTFFMFAAPKIEPIYSLNYVRSIIIYILRADFFTMQRYVDFQFEGTFIFRSWLTPTMQGALFVLSLYTVVFFLFGSLLFKRRQI